MNNKSEQHRGPETSNPQSAHEAEVNEVDPRHEARLSVYDGRNEDEYGSFIGG